MERFSTGRQYGHMHVKVIDLSQVGSPTVASFWITNDAWNKCDKRFVDEMLSSVSLLLDLPRESLEYVPGNPGR